MKAFFFSTSASWLPLILRLTLGAVMFPHGAQKLLGWWGGYGFKGTMGFFTGTIGLPYVLGAAIILTESIGALALIAGFATRFWAVAFIVVMLGAIVTVQWPNGFFMNWFGGQAGEGIEFSLLMIGIAVALLIEGGGRYAVDGLLR
ncbi:MAG TPA: DoxX family protein [Flavobacteriales bacterium]|nr:DoxX family protein [Flavobacteriales bacterium]